MGVHVGIKFLIFYQYPYVILYPHQVSMVVLVLFYLY